MKMIKLVGIIVFIAVIGITFSGCGDEASKEQSKSRMDNQPIIDLSWGGKVTIKSADLYLDADWEKIVANVLDALERGYNNIEKDFFEAGNQSIYKEIFAPDQDFKVVVANSGRECEIKVGEYRTLYLKSSSLKTVNVQPAIDIMYSESGNYQSVAKIMPGNGKNFTVSDVIKFV